MTLEEMRERAAAAVQRAEEIEARMRAADEPSADDQAAFDAARIEAEGLYDQIEAIEQRSSAVASLRERGNAPRNRAGSRSLESHNENALPHNDPANTRNGRHGYSVLRALAGALHLRDGGGRFDGIEAETHQELNERSGGGARGVLIPWDAPLHRSAIPSGARFRDLTTTTGAGAIPTVTEPTLIDLLRAKLVTASLGATVINGMTQAFKLPRQNAGTSGYWVGEQVAITKSNATVDYVPFTPKTCGAYTILSRKFLHQSVFNGEQFAVNDLVATVAQTLEAAAIKGTGSANQPKGILNYGGTIGSVAMGTNGGAMTWAKLNEMIGKVNTANAPDGSRAWLVNPALVAKWSATPRETGFPKYLYDADLITSPIAGYPAAITSLMPSDGTKGTGTALSSAIFAVWSELMIALMSPLDVVADPYSMADSGDVRFVALQEADVNLRHPESFCICTDIVTT